MLHAFEVNRAFGRRLRECRERARMSQQELASKADVRRSTIANIEAGGQATSLFQLYAFAGALSVTVDELLPNVSFEPESEIVERLRRHSDALLTG
jgi:transcriptional regulator with XRE-family HTH domain